MELNEFRLFSCAQCGSWCSDAGWRNVAASFTPLNYFANDDADRDKWRDLDHWIERAGRQLHSVLDVGCGTGAYLAHLRASRPEAGRAGIELDPDRAERARRADPGAIVHTGDACEVLERETDCFDLITLWDVFEHVPAPARLLRALSARLSAKGCVFIQTINEQSVVPALGRLSYRLSGGNFRGAVRRTHDAHHLVFFTRAGLEVLAERSGLRIVEHWFDHLALERMDGGRLLTTLTAALLAVERALGNGLFINLVLEPSPGKNDPDPCR